MGSPESKEESGRNEARGQLSQATFMYSLLAFCYYTSHEELFEQKQTHGLKELMVAGGRMGEVREFGTDIYTLLHLKWITNKDLLYSTGNSAQC